jgi:hypothetical protein
LIYVRRPSLDCTHVAIIFPGDYCLDDSGTVQRGVF